MKGLVKQDKAGMGRLDNTELGCAGSSFLPGLRGQREEIWGFGSRSLEEMLCGRRTELRNENLAED